MERELFYQINQEWTTPVLDRVMALASSLDFWMVPLIILIVAILIFGGFKGRAFIVVLALTIGLTDGVVVHTLKESVNRLRPSQYAGTRLVQLEKTSPRLFAIAKPPKIKTAKIKKPQLRGVSFPSGHTANNFAAAAVFLLFFGWRGAWFLIMASLVAYSRMYTGSHWPGDVAFSIILGLVLGWLVTLGCERLWRRIGPRLIPGLYQRHPSLIGSKTHPTLSASSAIVS